MELAFALLALINLTLVVILAFVAVAHYTHDWTHAQRGLVALTVLSIFLVEVGAAIYRNEGSLVSLALVALTLVFTVVKAIQYGFNAAIQSSTSRPNPHLSSSQYTTP